MFNIKKIRYRTRVVYINLLLKIYSIIRMTLPKVSKCLGKHIEKVSLINAKHIRKIISNNEE